MKLKHWFITLFIFFTCHTVVSANGTLDNLTQDDGISALEAGDALGFEVLSRAELENVRGEWSPSVILRGIKYLNQDNIQAFRRTLGLNSCDWLCQWAINNPQAVIAWLNTQL